MQIQELHEKLEEHKSQLKNIRIELDGEKIIMLEELKELEELKTKASQMRKHVEEKYARELLDKSVRAR